KMSSVFRGVDSPTPVGSAGFRLPDAVTGQSHHLTVRDAAVRSSPTRRRRHVASDQGHVDKSSATTLHISNNTAHLRAGHAVRWQHPGTHAFRRSGPVSLPRTARVTLCTTLVAAL